MVINSTSNRMRVIFHSDEAVQSDGFHAVWSENCGGIFQATDKVNIIQSPSYPNLYTPNVFCNYTIVAPNDDIIVEFTDFQLERGKYPRQQLLLSLQNLWEYPPYIAYKRNIIPNVRFFMNLR